MIKIDPCENECNECLHEFSNFEFFLVNYKILNTRKNVIIGILLGCKLVLPGFNIMVPPVHLSPRGTISETSLHFYKMRVSVVSNHKNSQYLRPVALLR